MEPILDQDRPGSCVTDPDLVAKRLPFIETCVRQLQVVAPWLLLSVALGCGGQAEDSRPSSSAGGQLAHEDPASGGSTATSGECDPLDDRCAAGSYCQLVDGVTRCVEEGSAARDEPCDEDGRCQRGSMCLPDGIRDLCLQPCPRDNEFICDNRRHTCFVVPIDQGEDLPFWACEY